jgi:hypothetical protein
MQTVTTDPSGHVRGTGKLARCQEFSSDTDTLLPHSLIFSGVLYYFLNHLLYSRSFGLASLDCFLACPLEDWVCTAFYTHLQFRGRVSGVNFGPFCIFLNSIHVVRCALLILGNCSFFTVTSVTLNTLNSIFEHHLECDSDFLSLLNLCCSGRSGPDLLLFYGIF